jgi:hypothetical protein
VISLSKGLEDPGGLWAGRFKIGLVGAMVVLPLVVCEVLVAAGAVARHAPPDVLAPMKGVPAAAALVALHFAALAFLVRLAGRGLAARWVLSGVNQLRLHNLAKLYGRHRRVLKAYFAEREKPHFLVEVDEPGGGVPGRAAALVMGSLCGALLLEFVVFFAQHQQGLRPLEYAREACLGVAAITLIGLLFGDLDRVRARVLVGLGAGGLLVLSGLRPALVGWGPGLVPAMIVLLVVTVVRVTRPERATRVLFLTDLGLRLVRLAGEEIEDVQGATLKPERLILHPGNGESEWELFASGHEPLKVQPIGGHAQEIGVFGALHGFPVRVSGDGGAGSLTRELVRNAKAVVPVGAILAWLVVQHWVPGIAALL